MRVFFVGKQMVGAVYLLVISQANERKEQTPNKGCAFVLPWDLPDSALGRLAGDSQSCLMAQGGRSPVVNGQVLLLLLGITVTGLVSRGEEVARRGWDGKLSSILWVSCLSVVCRRSAWPGFTALFLFCWRKNRASGLWGS